MTVRVLKFGSSVLRGEHDLPAAVAEIAHQRSEGTRVVAVVSALGGTTDRLLRRARRVAPAPGTDQIPEPIAEPIAALLATGELQAASLLALALAAGGVAARLLGPQRAGLRTHGPILDARPVACDRTRILAAARRSVVVVPGFLGVDDAGRTTLLGRGGSDLTALCLAALLGGDCTLYKDVPGLYTADPRRDPRAVRFERASYVSALAVGGELVQPKALRFAAERGLELYLTAPGSPAGTRIGGGPDRLAEAGDRIASPGHRSCA